MAFLNLTLTTRLPAILRRAYSEARVPTAGGTRNIASTDTDENEELVALVNECQRDLFDQFTMLNVTVAVLNVIANDKFTQLPADLRDSDILQLFWDNNIRDSQTIQMKSLAEMQLLGMDWTADTSTAVYPEFAVLPTVVGNALGWYKVPSQNLTVKCLYRQLENQFLVSDLTAINTQGTLCSVPDRLVPVLALMIAVELSDRNNGLDSGHGAMLRAKSDKKISEWQRKLGRFTGADTNEILETGGYPKMQNQLSGSYEF